MLAYESQQKNSFWRPYLDTLPATPSAGWLMKPQDSSNALKGLGVTAAYNLQV